MQKQTFVFARSLALALLAATTLCAQWSQQEFNRAIEGVERDTVTGKPYSATAVSTTTQILADGTKISRSMQATLARDSEGRTRREQSMNLVFTTAGPQTNNVTKHMVSIKDPVAQVRYILQPDDQTALKVSLASTSVNITEFKRKQMELETKQAAEGKTGGVELDLQDRLKAAAELKLRAEKLVQVQVGTIGYAVMPDGNSKAQVEDLGVRVIEGVNARGQRETRTIPVGQIGNDRAIQIVSEVWVSDDLQTIVLSKNSDPRVGDSEYRLTNISRAEPARSLFELPAGYSLKEESRRE
jgi:hypothetical protein